MAVLPSAEITPTISEWLHAGMADLKPFVEEFSLKRLLLHASPEAPNFLTPPRAGRRWLK
jgi:hypothetical protein